MRRIVLIDGENLVYGLRIMLAPAGEDRAPRSVIDTLNIRGMFEEYFQTISLLKSFGLVQN